MTPTEAAQIQRDYYALAKPSDADEFAFEEACEYLIYGTDAADEATRASTMENLGGFYYEKRDFQLALKYYEMAYDAGDNFVVSNLGYIWYYGRTGKVDYQKAFFYYSEAMEQGFLIPAYKVADMYKSGHYVAKDIGRYKSMIRDLYTRVKDTQYLSEPLPEIFKRLAAIEAEEGNCDTALTLYERARDFLAQRISHDAFFGDLIVMDEIVCAYYKLVPFDPDCFDLYDLFYLLKTPCTVQFYKDGTAYQVSAVQEDAACVIRFGDAWYRTRNDFFGKACIENIPLTAQYRALTEFEVL